MRNDLHHVHKRKKNCEKKCLSSNKWKDLMDKLIYIVALIGPLITIPQIIKIWVEKNAGGVSMITWSAYLIGGMFWLTYGIMHKEKPIILTNILWILMDVMVIIGVYVYG